MRKPGASMATNGLVAFDSSGTDCTTMATCGEHAQKGGCAQAGSETLLFFFCIEKTSKNIADARHECFVSAC
jgi:hypothetical protein